MHDVGAFSLIGFYSKVSWRFLVEEIREMNKEMTRINFLASLRYARVKACYSLRYMCTERPT